MSSACTGQQQQQQRQQQAAEYRQRHCQFVWTAPANAQNACETILLTALNSALSVLANYTGTMY
jgi:hypothetical protein